MNLKFATEIGKADTAEEQNSVLLKHLNSFGYDRFAYAMVPISFDAEMGEYLSMSNLNSDWMRMYADQELHKSDPLAIHCLTETVPLLWSFVLAKMDNGSLPKAQAEVAKLAKEQGFLAGVTIPLRQVGAYRAGISLFAIPTIGTEDHDLAFSEHKKALIEICDMFHARLDRRLLSKSHYRLTKREAEVLHLLSHGYLEKQIVHQTGRSIHTIQKQIRSAKQRLNAATPAQAIAKATMLGILG